MSKIEVPENVLKALEFTREMGPCNMLDINCIIMFLENTEVHSEAAEWIENNRRKYGSVLSVFSEYLENKDKE